jgi:Protein kinase domain
VPTQSPTPAAELLLSLRASGLLSTQQVDDLAAATPCREFDGALWVQDLVERRILTDFQGEQLLAGQSGALVLGHYCLLDRLGAGGMGQVFKAEHMLMKRLVALKVIAAHLLRSADAVARFFHEVEVAARLTHPNIITAYDAAEAKGLHFLVMEYVDGIDLGRLVNESGPLSPALACEYVRQAALGLQHAHEQDLVHCDIKPANLLVRHRTVRGSQISGEVPLVKILDFGLARLAGSPSASVPSLHPSHLGSNFAGTPDYMAPEQARDCLAADIRSDLYSLGCTFFYLLTGAVPYPGGTWAEKLLQHQFDPVPSVLDRRPELPVRLAAIVRKLMAKEPAERVQTPAELAEALQGVGCGIGFQSCRTKADRIGILSHDKPKRRAWRWPLAAGLAIMVGLGIACLVRPPAKRDGASFDKLAELGVVQANYVLLKANPGHPFADLQSAVAEAHDGDTIVLHGDGPFPCRPLVITGKALTIRAARGSRPQLQLALSRQDAAWQPLLLTDHALVLEGLELRHDGSAEHNVETAHLVYSERGNLRLQNCSLLAPHGCALVVSRAGQEVELRRCRLLAQAAALCVEASTATPHLRLAECTITVQDPAGAALSLWTAEHAQEVSAQVDLERNTIQSGRILAVAGPLQRLQVTARGNDFAFRQALVSCCGMAALECWRGNDNIYRGRSQLLVSNGSPVDVRRSSGWHEVQSAVQAESIQETPAYSESAALRAPSR